MIKADWVRSGGSSAMGLERVIRLGLIGTALLIAVQTVAHWFSVRAAHQPPLVCHIAGPVTGGDCVPPDGR